MGKDKTRSVFKPVELEPSLIAADFARIGEEVQSVVDAGAHLLHLDVMDGLFVPNFTMGPSMVAAVKRVAPELVLDVHLMIYAPELHIDSFIDAGADEITFHIEATEHVEEALRHIKKRGCAAGLALRPVSGAGLIERLLPLADKILVMTVEPGFGGQAFMPKMLEKVRQVRSLAQTMGCNIDVQVDGGINAKTGKECVVAGANRLVAGTYFFSHSDRRSCI